MNKESINIPTPKEVRKHTGAQDFTNEEIYDKILGALVGSAIGDAMGASTEMWERGAIQNKYGYITGLTPAIRTKSPEGTWQHNMIAGATTDDTRWKYFIGQYLTTFKSELSSKNLASFIVDYYQVLVKGLDSKEVMESTDVLDREMEKVNWIKEWARVAMAYGKGDSEFAVAKNRFYGGEMSCAGMLYAPIFGLVASSPENAYLSAFEHSIFDIGYARDISALTATLTYNAMLYSNMDSVLDESMMIDPHGYVDSRLIGRLSAEMALEARSWVRGEVSLPQLEDGEELPVAPESFDGSSEDWFRLNVIYDRMEVKQKAIAFHAGEIWQILIASLEFGKGDFLKTIQFIINYGRDNDTVAAVAGMVLGANVGYSNLPAEVRDEVVRVSREIMGLDIEELAESLSENI